MLNEKNKATRIMKEIISYFLENDLNQFDLSFKIDSKECYLSVQAPADVEPDDFQQLLSDLQAERQIELDEYYNALLGSHSKHDYSFLGKTIDKAEGGYKDGVLSLELWRFNLD